MKTPEFNAEETYQLAMQAYQSGQLPMAELHLRNILMHLPDNDGIIATLGGILLASGKVEEGISQLETAVRINNNNLEAKVNLGVAYQNTGRIDEASELVGEVAKALPDRADIQFNYANTLLQKQNYKEGIIVLKKVIELQPDFLQAHQMLGSIYTYLNDIEKAIEVFNNILLQVPNDLTTIINLGNLYADTGQNDKAIEIYKNAIKVQPNHPIPHAVLGKLYSDIGKNEAAESSLLT